MLYLNVLDACVRAPTFFWHQYASVGSVLAESGTVLNMNSNVTQLAFVGGGSMSGPYCPLLLTPAWEPVLVVDHNDNLLLVVTAHGHHSTFKGKNCRWISELASSALRVSLSLD